MRRIRRPGGCIFAERPDLPAPQARIIWSAEADPSVLSVVAEAAAEGAPSAFEIARLAQWAAIAIGADGAEHLVVSDGYRRLRLDVREGSLVEGGPVRLVYSLSGLTGLDPKILTLQRLLMLWRTGRFAPSLFAGERRLPRWLRMLQVRDALVAGASQREIAAELFGQDLTAAEWNGRSDFLRSRVRRLAAEARAMASGGYRDLLR